MRIIIKKGGYSSMKGYKIFLCALCAVVMIVAVITAITIFRNEIKDFFVEIKDKIDIRRNGEFADYADM